MNRFLPILLIALFSFGLTMAVFAASDGPTISSVALSPTMVAASDLVHVTVQASDNQGVVSVTADSFALINMGSGVWECDIIASAEAGSHTVTIVATDTDGNTATDTSGSYSTMPVVGIACNHTTETATVNASSIYLFKIWGAATYVDENTFTVSDGGSQAVTVDAPGHTVCSGDFVVARGVLNAPEARISSALYWILKTTRQGMTLNDVSVGKDMQVAMAVALDDIVPLGSNVNVLITSSDSRKVLLSKTATALGRDSIVVTVPGGSRYSPNFYVQALSDSGSVQVTATGQECVGDTFNVTLTPSGFVFNDVTPITKSTFSPNYAINVNAARLTTDGQYAQLQTLRGGIGAVSVPVSISDAQVATITESPVVFNSGQSTATTYLNPNEAGPGGTAVITVEAPVGFAVPANNTHIDVTVSKPDITASGVTVGKFLQTGGSFQLTAVPPAPVDVTVTVDSDTIATVAKNSNEAGSKTITFTGVSNTSTRAFYVQGVSVGSTQLTIEAAGYNSKTVTVTVDKSGFKINSPTGINTSATAANTTIEIVSGRLNSSDSFIEIQPLAAGIGNINVLVTSSNTAVGTIVTSPVVFNANESLKTTAFDPAAAGNTTISIGTPTNFTTPSTSQSISANVTATNGTINMAGVVVGKNLQTTATISLSKAPTSPVSVIVTVNDSSVALVSKSASAAGSSSVTFTNVSSTSVGTIYVQGIENGTATLTATATGYDDKTANVTVDPSGFRLSSTTAFEVFTLDANTSITIKSCRLTSAYAYSADQSIRAGFGSVNVPISSSNESIGTITVNPVVFNSTDGSKITYFDPGLTPGTAVISLGSSVSGFDTPTNYQQVNATVTEPTINAWDVAVGKDLQKSATAALSMTPASPVDMTVTVENASIATLSTNPTDAGGVSVTFSSVNSTASKTFYVQGLATGSTTLTVSAPGFATKVTTITVDLSGFVIYTGAFSVSQTAANKAIDIRPARLNSSTRAWAEYQNIRGGYSSVQVSVTSSNIAAGQITVSPLTFTGNVSSAITYFDPIAVGTSTISVVTPEGFSTPTTKAQINATVY
ncbi:MAG: beta strand repeat-containing protein [Armatimonadota bacterium]